MQHLTEEQRVGLDYLATGTELLRRVRAAHPTKGIFEAAELNWWWGVERPTDTIGQLFWFDEHGRPEAAVLATQWGDKSIGLDPALLPDATPELVEHVLTRGVAHMAALGFGQLDVMIDRDDGLMRAALQSLGFVGEEDETALKPDVEAWLDAATIPEISELADGYHLHSRAETTDRPHHMTDEGRPKIEQRLQQGPLYRADLDLVVLAADETPAGHGIFWFDSETKTGVVEPMRTHETHQKKGLARHILTAGLQRLVNAGAERIKIAFDPLNTAAQNLYLDVGFQPVKETEILSRQAS